MTAPWTVENEREACELAVLRLKDRYRNTDSIHALDDATAAIRARRTPSPEEATAPVGTDQVDRALALLRQAVGKANREDWRIDVHTALRILTAAFRQPPPPADAGSAEGWFINWVEQTWRGCADADVLAGTSVSVGQLRELSAMFSAVRPKGAVTSPAGGAEWQTEIEWLENLRWREEIYSYNRERIDALIARFKAAPVGRAVKATDAMIDAACDEWPRTYRLPFRVRMKACLVEALAAMSTAPEQEEGKQT